jgi:chemotaxis protein methyltransferase CheR
MVKLSTPRRPSEPASTFAAGAAEDQEFEFSSVDFERVRRLIYQRAGISLNPSKQSMVYSRLARRLRALRLNTFAAYLDQLEMGVTEEWQQFVNSLTTNLTSFYREAHHFPVLTEYLHKLKERPRINIWCCAASTGEEPYTLAITAMEAFRSMTPPVRILATDIDTRVLEIARNGMYPEEVVEKLPSALVHRYFLKGTGANAGFVRVRPEVMQLITFKQLNLLDEAWPVRPGFSAIFCRNVMIYFDKTTQHGILRRFAPLLESDGLLFAGHSENFSYARDLFRSRGQTVYELAKLGQGAGNV